MKPVHHLMIVALKNAIIMVAGFAMYEFIEDLKFLWKKRFPESVYMHEDYGRAIHLFSVFVADFAIGMVIYQLFNFLH